MLFINSDIWALQIILNQILKEKNTELYIINKCQGNHCDSGIIPGKPCSGTRIDLGELGLC